MDSVVRDEEVGEIRRVERKLYWWVRKDKVVVGDGFARALRHISRVCRCMGGRMSSVSFSAVVGVVLGLDLVARNNPLYNPHFVGLYQSYFSTYV